MARIIRKTFKVDGIPTNVTSALLSDPTGAFGVKRNDTDAVVVADGTVMTNVSAGVYEYEFADVVGVAYTAYVEMTYAGAVYRFEVEFAARLSDSGGPISYSILKDRVGRYLFGGDPGDSRDSGQLAKINDCINDGLKRVYAAHEWSFFRPLANVATTAPYATGTITIASGVVTLTGGTFPSWAADGILMVDNKYCAVLSRGSGSQLTLNNTSISIATASNYQLARPEIPMDASFDSVAKGSSDLTFYPDPDQWYPSVRQQPDLTIRKLEAGNPKFDRPVFYSERTVTFDPTVGSRKSLAFYPTPDAAYVMRVQMILRQVDLSDANPFPVGGEMLSQVILEACLASAEHNYEEREHVHEKRYLEMIALAIRNDQERSCPTSLGPDSPRGEYGNFGVLDYDYRRREQRIGTVTMNGDAL
jgi:hypothetical protein